MDFLRAKQAANEMAERRVGGFYCVPFVDL